MAEDAAFAAREPEGRDEAFMQRLGLARGFYMLAIEACVAHALARKVAAPDTALVPWTGLGARNIGGRIRALVQDPLRPALLYAGAAQGGVFASNDGGDTWAPVGNPEHAFPVGALAVAPARSSVVYIGSGEPGFTHGGTPLTANQQFASGRGFYRFDPAAATPMQREVPPLPQDGTAPALGSADAYSAIAVDPNNADRCWIASHTGLWRREAGPVFTREPVPAGLPAAPAVGALVSDVIVVPHWNAARPRTLRIYAAVAAVGIFRGVFDPANAAAGTVWDPMLTVGLPLPSAPAAPTWDRIRIAHCAAQPNQLYVIAGDAPSGAVMGVWSSANGGNSWVPCVTPVLGGQIWVNLVIAVHPANPAIVVAGGVDLALSRSSGQLGPAGQPAWELIINWSNFGEGDRGQHGDVHALLFDAADPHRLWVGNDGGISMAQDVVQANPATAGLWRKRSHGIVAAQFNDIATHPTYPFMLGGGLQDNGGYISFGGESWHMVGDADGGQIGMPANDPRTFIVPNQGTAIRSTVTAPTDVTPTLGFYPSVQRRIINGDLPPPDDVFACRQVSRDVPPLAGNAAPVVDTAPLFVPLVEMHRSTTRHLLYGRGFNAAGATATADVYVSTDNLGTTVSSGLQAFVQPPAVVPFIGNANVSALAYGNGANPASTDWWVGTTQGHLLRRPNSGANPAVWRPLNLPASAAGLLISRIAVHPADGDVVAVSACDSIAPHQGRVYLTLDRGGNWMELTGLAAVGAPAGAAPALLSLPPGPVTALCFDPQPAAAVPQVLYAATLAGVYVSRNLPARNAGAAALNFNPRWHVFDGIAALAQLPLTLVKDLRIITLPRDATAPAGTPESLTRHRLVAASYGRGMHACDITQGYPAAIGAGGPQHRIYIRQTVIEDGLSYPRPAPAVLNAAPGSGAGVRMGGDPRFPTAPAPRLFTDREAFDIRIDRAPFQFFHGRIDGVEFDEDLHTRTLAPGELNVIRVQVHTRGWRRSGVVDVDLYFAVAPDPGAPNTPASANAAPLPDLQADFWQHWTENTLPAPAAATNAPRAVWQRVGSREILGRVAPNQPEVARFEWVPPANLAGGFVALLALCSSTNEPLPAAPPTVMRDLIRNERRAALRVVRAEPFVPELFIRDGLDDDGRLGGVAFGGRSPDIIVVGNAPADPQAMFSDLGDDRAGDRIRAGGAANVIYVRVHNRKAVDSAADVELFWALPHAPASAAPGQAGPPFDASKWQVIAAVDAVNITVPANGTRLARFDFNAAPAAEPDFPNALALIALVRSHDGADPTPQRAGVDTQEEFWRFFLGLANANNAALRALRYA